MKWSAEELNGASITGATWTPAGNLVVNESTIVGMDVGARLSVSSGAEFEVIHVQITTSNNETLNLELTIEISPKGH